METEFVLYILSFALLFLGIAGTFLPMLPGLIFSLAGLFLYALGTDASLSSVYLWIFSILTVFSWLLEYLIPAHTTKKYGGTRWGSIGSVVGMVVGFFLPIPLGFLVGMFAGVFVGELLHNRQDYTKALNAVKGSFIGFLYGTGFSFLVALAMLFVVVVDVVQRW